MRKIIEIANRVDMILESSNEWDFTVTFHNRKTKEYISLPQTVGIRTVHYVLGLIKNEKRLQRKRIVKKRNRLMK